MSLVERRPNGQALPRAFAAVSIGLALSGCIQPLYGPLSGGGDVAGELQAIAVEPIPNRLGHYLGNELIFGFNGTGSQVPPKYRLIVTVTENVQTPLIDTVSGYPSAANVVVNADYRLMPAGGTEPITKGQATVVASYDRTSQRFSNLRAARDAEIRDAKRLADEIRTRVAAAIAARG
ncbi:MAG: LPS assembly lipoprotein LptE [Pseudomonadota bacterium]|nr:LPS assembly lipoprotein LptE [Pseudomonadota bacterium]